MVQTLSITEHHQALRSATSNYLPCEDYVKQTAQSPRSTRPFNSSCLQSRQFKADRIKIQQKKTTTRSRKIQADPFYIRKKELQNKEGRGDGQSYLKQFNRTKGEKRSRKKEKKVRMKERNFIYLKKRKEEKENERKGKTNLKF